MITQPFTNAITGLNEAQRKAVNAIEGAVMVIAGPGTGKTQILTLRIANILLKTDSNPENILALTFTESGVSAMRKRLVEIIGTPGYRVEISTFHGFCNDLIKNNPEDFPHFISSDTVDDITRIQIIENIIDKEKFTYLKPFGDQFHYVKPALTAIGELKKEGVTVAKFEESIQKDQEDFKKIVDLYHEKGMHKGKMKGDYEKRLKNIHKNKELLVIYRSYQKELQLQKLYDYEDMLLEVIKAYEKDSQFLLRSQEQYQYIHVDEHQDTNAAQNKIIELLCNFYPNPNLFVVGDEKQSIYRFQGASLENFLYFKKLYPEALLINLKENYRSSQMILDASGEIIKNNLLASKFIPENTQLVAKINHPQEKIKILAAADFYEEYYCIADVIKKKIAEGTRPGQIAILAKENRDIMPCIDVLEQQGVPYVLESNLAILQDIEIQKLILLFTAIYTFGSDIDLIRAMHIDCLQISPVDIVTLIKIAHDKKTTVWEILCNGEYKNESSLKTSQEIENFYKNLISWKTYSHNEHFDYLFKKVINDSGLISSFIAKKNSLQNLDKLTGFYEDIKQRIERTPSFNLENFMEYLALIKKHDISLKKNVKTVYKNAVRLMTAHKSKGLEFDYVFIMNVYDGHWGNPRKRGSKFTLPWEYLQEKLTAVSEEEKNEDERRLFYVAMTRARKEIFISYSMHALDGKERVPSQFIEEILEVYKELVNIEAFEKNFLENKQIILAPLSQTGKDDIVNEYLANKELFAEMFAHKGFAATHLNNYLDCPWKYFFRNLLGLPDVMTKSLLFGSAIHQTINRYLEGRKQSSDSLSFVLHAYHDALLRQPVTKEELKELEEKGKNMLEGYYQERMIHFKKDALSELNIKGVHFSEKVKLTGKIDMIEPLNDLMHVVVTDFKTGKPKSRGVIEGSTQSGRGDYKRQLVFYKILLDRYHYKKMKMVQGVIDFVEPNEKGVYKREVFDITEEEVKDLELQIIHVTDEILSFGFWDKGCKKDDCAYCALRAYIGN